MTSVKRLILAALGLAVIVLGSQFVTGGPAGAYPSRVPASISVSPHPQCGKPVTVSGQHFKPGEVVHIKVNGHTEATTTADKNGDFSVTFPLNCYGADSLTFTANGVDGDVDSLTVMVGHSTGNTVVHGSGHGSAGGGGSGTDSGSGNGAGGLSYTGVAVFGIGGLGVTLLLAGGLLLFAGKRRRLT